MKSSVAERGHIRDISQMNHLLLNQSKRKMEHWCYQKHRKLIQVMQHIKSDVYRCTTIKPELDVNNTDLFPFGNQNGVTTASSVSMK